jgi:hypothetical protein
METKTETVRGRKKNYTDEEAYNKKIEFIKNYNKEHSERIKEYKKQYYEKNKERILEKQRAYDRERAGYKQLYLDLLEKINSS